MLSGWLSRCTSRCARRRMYSRSHARQVSHLGCPPGRARWAACQMPRARARRCRAASPPRSHWPSACCRRRPARGGGKDARASAMRMGRVLAPLGVPAGCRPGCKAAAPAGRCLAAAAGTLPPPVRPRVGTCSLTSHREGQGEDQESARRAAPPCTAPRQAGEGLHGLRYGVSSAHMLIGSAKRWRPDPSTVCRRRSAALARAAGRHAGSSAHFALVH